MVAEKTGLLEKFSEEWEVVGIFYITGLTTRFAFTLTMMVETIYLFAVGISFAQIGVIYLVFGVIHGVFEIPTGIVADKYGRKTSTLIGFGVCGISFFLVPFYDSFYYLLFLFSGFAFGSTFISGSFAAWLIDTLKSKGLDDWIHRVMARQGSISGLVAVPASLIGALVLFISRGGEVLSPSVVLMMRIFFLTHGALFILTFFLLYFKAEEVRVGDSGVKETNFFSYIKNTIRKGFRLVKRSRIVLILFVSVSVFFFSFTVLQDAWQPYLTTEIGFELYWLGVIAAITSFLKFIVNLKSEEFTEKVGSYPLMLLISTALLGSLVVLFSAIDPGYLVMVVYILIMTIFAFHRLIRGAYLQENIPSSIRATMGSVDSLIIEIAGGLGSFFIFGLISDLFSLDIALRVGGIILLVSSLIYVALIWTGDEKG
ncbi:MAG: MFS transporter [Candidatus Thermoplasmatota archaeon]